MDYDALKDQWSEVEDRDGIRLSWNTFPSSRMVIFTFRGLSNVTHLLLGSFSTRRTHRSPLHALEGETRRPIAAIRTSNLQSSLSSCPEPFRVCGQACRKRLRMADCHRTVDTRARLWICPFCLSRNGLPAHYKDITQDNIPPELHPSSTTIEYRLARPAPAPPILVYVVDTCQEEDSMKALKDRLVMSLSLLPSNALVGLITFGTMVHLAQDGLFTAC